MSPDQRGETERWERLGQVVAAYLRDLESGSPPSRDDLLARHPDLAEHLRALFAAQDRESGEGPVTTGEEETLPVDARPDPPFDTLSATVAHGTGDAKGSQPGGRFGDYEILEEIAHGGMGVVYKARQVSLGRIVAVKMMLAGKVASPEQIERFRTEAEAAAKLQHPGIVAIHEVGEIDGHHFFSMDYVEGKSLDDAIRENPLNNQRAAHYVKSVAEAIEHAHQHGVLHRDLKPSNVLIDSSDQPRVTDFGLAKRTEEDSGLTASGQVLGTPSYMPPEQAEGKSEAIGPRSDVYSLGAVLYALLCARPPFRGDSVANTLLQVTRDEPISPRLLNPTVHRDLETICLKCLEKDASKRYASAGELAQELQRFLAGKPIKARPLGRVQRFWRWCRREPLVAGLTAAAVSLLVSLAVVATIGYVVTSDALTEAKEERERANGQRDVALAAKAEESKQRQLALDNLALQRRATYNVQLARVREVMQRDGSLARELLQDTERCPPELRDFTWGYFHRLAYRPRRALRQHRGAVVSVAFSPDGKLLVSVCEGDMTVRLWDARTGKHLRLLDQGSSFFSRLSFGKCVAFSPDGKTVVTASGSVKLWDTTNGTLKKELTGHRGAVHGMAFARAGDVQVLATAGTDKTIKLWDCGKSRELRTLNGHDKTVASLAASPDGAALASAGHDGKVILWDAATGNKKWTINEPTGVINCIAFSPNGELLASAGTDKAIRLWDATNGKLHRSLHKHATQVKALAFSPDGKTLVSGGVDRMVVMWNSANGQELGTLKHVDKKDPKKIPATAFSLAYSPDGKVLAAGSEAGPIVMWGMAPVPTHLSIPAHQNWIWSVAVSPDGKSLATASRDKTVVLRNMETGRQQVLKGHQLDVSGVAFSPDGRTLASCSWDKTIRLWNAKTGQLKRILSGHTSEVDGVSFSPDGKSLASTGWDGTVRLWNFQTGAETATLEGHTDGVKSVAFSPHAKWLASASLDKTVRLWDAVTGKLLQTMTGHAKHVLSIAFSPDSRSLASASSDHTVKLWDVPAGKERATLLGHTDFVMSLAFSPHGAGSPLLASTGFDGTIRLWDVQTAQERATLRGHTGGVRCSVFSPDGRALFTGGDEGAIKLWWADPSFVIRD